MRHCTKMKSNNRKKKLTLHIKNTYYQILIMEFSLESRIKSLKELVKIRVKNLELNKIYKENPEKKNMKNWAIARDKYMESKNFKYDIFNQWTDNTKDTPFEGNKKKCIGNGEKQSAKELDILRPLGGQNSVYDLFHPEFGPISIKDMTDDNCTLGVEGRQNMIKILMTTVNPFLSWIIKYQSKCNLANKFYDDINKSYGSSKNTIYEGIYRYELSESNLSKLNELLNELKSFKSNISYDSLKSEYVHDIINSLGDKSLKDLLDECVRIEATTMTLIIVHKKKGWLVVKDLSKLSCPRITRGAPRINYDFN